MLNIRLCCQRARQDHESFSRTKATPLPWGKVLVLSAVLFVDQFGSNMLFPFLPFMTHDFFPDLNRQEIGQKAGYLGSAYFIGNFAGSMTWGWLSDILGRRPVMLMGVCGTVFSELLFGFSQNFGWAIAGRFLWGLLNGNMGVVKTYVSEICDDTNQAKGYAVLGTTASISRLMGSVAGGFLAQPASKYAVLQVPFFCQFPYVLPCLVGAGMSTLSFIAAFVFLDETLHTKKKKKTTRRISDQSDCSQSSEMKKQGSGERAETDDSEIEMNGTVRLIADSDIDSQSDFEIVSAESSDVELLVRVPQHNKHRRWISKAKNIPSEAAERAKKRLHHYRQQCISCVMWCTHCKCVCSVEKTQSYMVGKTKATVAKLKMMLNLLRDRRVLVSTGLLGILGFITIIIIEVFPLLMVTYHEHGGYTMDSSEIGVVLMVVGVCELIWQLTLYPRITKCLGYRWTLRFGILMFAAMCVLLPFSSQITGPVPVPTHPNDTSSGSVSENGSGSGFGSGLLNTTDYCGNDLNSTVVSVNENSVKRIPVYIWVVVIGIYGFLVIGRVMSLTSDMILISNSALPEMRGTVNGIGESLAAFGRTLGPMTGAPLFAWTADHGKSWPVNYHFTFDFMAVLAILAAAISLLLPKTIEKKRDTIESAKQN